MDLPKLGHVRQISARCGLAYSAFLWYERRPGRGSAPTLSFPARVSNVGPCDCDNWVILTQLSIPPSQLHSVSGGQHFRAPPHGLIDIENALAEPRTPPLIPQSVSKVSRIRWTRAEKAECLLQLSPRAPIKAFRDEASVNDFEQLFRMGIRFDEWMLYSYLFFKFVFPIFIAAEPSFAENVFLLFLFRNLTIAYLFPAACWLMAVTNASNDG